MAFDGIDDPHTYEGSQLGVASLHPSGWFEPFHADAPLTPVACVTQRDDAVGQPGSEVQHFAGSAVPVGVQERSEVCAPIRRSGTVVVNEPAASTARRQLSSRTLTVSTCCWKVASLPSATVHTWTIFTTAGSPESLCFHV